MMKLETPSPIFSKTCPKCGEPNGKFFGFSPEYGAICYQCYLEYVRAHSDPEPVEAAPVSAPIKRKKRTIDPKSAVLGSLLALLIFGGYAYAQSHLSFTGSIYVPVSSDLEVVEGGDRMSNGVYQLPNLKFDRERITCEIRLKNTGRNDAEIRYDFTTPSGLGFGVLYDVYSLDMDTIPWNPNESITVPRGEVVLIVLVFTDQGMAEGDHPFSVEVYVV